MANKNNNNLTIQFSPNIKQDIVFDAFDDAHTTEVIYGGG